MKTDTQRAHEKYCAKHAYEWLVNAKLWVDKSDRYGDDMHSSRVSCIKDALDCVEKAKGFLIAYTKGFES